MGSSSIPKLPLWRQFSMDSTMLVELRIRYAPESSSRLVGVD